ncbi:hypothetical protein FQV30_03295 [Planomicrobium sp. CPCC 101110]|nr:hypothetical protein FQV30_03295 [Planomicrobium sp. CPCC 101110]
MIQNAEITLREFQGEETLTNEQRFSAFADGKGIESIDQYKAAVKQEAPKTAVAAGVPDAAGEAAFAEEPIAIEEIVLSEETVYSEETASEEKSAADETIRLPEHSTSIEKTEAVEETALEEELVPEAELAFSEDEVPAEEPASGKEKEDLEEINREGNRIYTTVASLMHLPPESPAVQKEMGAYYILLDRFYNCNPKMFRGLGDLYAADSRFSHNIDQHGAGLSKYLKNAMYIYADGIENA